MQARPHNSNDCHHSPAGQSSGSKITSSGGGATVNGGLRCLAITAPLRSPKLSELAVRLGGPVPPPATSRRPGMPLPRTQTRLLTLIRQRQRIDQPTQQQTVILDDLQQRIRPRLPRIASHNQRRATQLRLKQRDLVGRSGSLTQNLDLASIQHELAGYRGPKPNTRLPQASRRLRHMLNHIPDLTSTFTRDFTLSIPERESPRPAGPQVPRSEKSGLRINLASQRVKDRKLADVGNPPCYRGVSAGLSRRNGRFSPHIQCPTCGSTTQARHAQQGQTTMPSCLTHP
jgi:hypothetical protein